MHACVCHCCFHGRVSQSFSFLSLSSFLSSRNTSLHHGFKTPPLLVSQLLDWHAAAYFPQLCLLCPVVLCTLFLSHVSIFRMAQWCIYLSEIPFHSRACDCASLQNSLHHMCSAWMNVYVNLCHISTPESLILKRITIQPGSIFDIQLSELLFPVETLYFKYFINWKKWQTTDSSSHE